MGGKHANYVLRPLIGDDWVIRIRCAIETEDSVPEPDNAVVRGPNDLYLNRHPRGADIGLLIEVADDSLAKDRRKAAIYAANGVLAYWIINIVDRQIEVLTDADVAGRLYRDQRVVMPGSSIDVLLDGQSIGQLSVDDLLPPLAA